MGWYIRKGLNFGPLRVNFSRGGVGWSVGGKGFRYGHSARGQRYVSAGGGGIYYRKTLGGPSRGTPPTPIPRPQTTPQISPEPSQRPHQPSSAIPALPASARLTTSDLATLITDAQHRPRLPWYVVPAIAIAVLSVGLAGGWWLAILTGLTLAAVAFVLHRRNLELHSVQIDYAGLDVGELGIWGDIQRAIRALDNAQGVWATPLQLVGHPTTANADRQDAEISSTEPPGVITDIDSPNIVCDWWHACFLPHGLLIVADSRATVTPYRNIRVSGCDVKIADPNPPPDATITGTSWAHMLADGSRDPGYLSNQEVPICTYGQVIVTTPQHALRIILSRVEVAKGSVDNLVRAMRALRALPL
jgi:hypothetical protein